MSVLPELRKKMFSVTQSVGEYRQSGCEMRVNSRVIAKQVLVRKENSFPESI